MSDAPESGSTEWKIDKLLKEIDRISRSNAPHLHGLPLHRGELVKDMRSAVLEFLGGSGVKVDIVDSREFVAKAEQDTEKIVDALSEAIKEASSQDDSASTAIGTQARYFVVVRVGERETTIGTQTMDELREIAPVFLTKNNSAEESDSPT